MRIKVSLEQAIKLIDIMNNPNDWTLQKHALREVLPVLWRTINNKIFKNHDETYHIPDLSTLVDRIKKHDTRPDGVSRYGTPHYNQDYLDRKKRFKNVPFLPHVFDDFNFWRNIKIKARQYSKGKIGLQMDLREHGGSKNDIKGIVIHENTRSVLRATFLLAWKEIIKRILKSYARRIKRL